jgi:hypothetical protein
MLLLLLFLAAVNAQQSPPPWQCQFRVAIGIDVSGSVSLAGESRLALLRTQLAQRIQSELFDDSDGSYTGACIGLYQFATDATTLVSYTPNDKTVMDAIANLQFSMSHPAYYTNWEAALLGMMWPQRPNVVYLVTDGLPTTRNNCPLGGQPCDDYDANMKAARDASLVLQGCGVRVVPVAIASTAQLPDKALAAISGPCGPCTLDKDFFRLDVTAPSGARVFQMPAPANPPPTAAGVLLEVDQVGSDTTTTTLVPVPDTTTVADATVPDTTTVADTTVPDTTVAPDATSADTTLDTTAAAETVPAVIPDTVPPTSPDPVSETVAETTVPATIPDTVAETTIPETSADTVPATVVDTTVPDTIPATIPETFADTTVPPTVPETSADAVPETVAETTVPATVPETSADTIPATVPETSPAAVVDATSPEANAETVAETSPSLPTTAEVTTVPAGTTTKGTSRPPAPKGTSRPSGGGHWRPGHHQHGGQRRSAKHLYPVLRAEHKRQQHEQHHAIQSGNNHRSRDHHESGVHDDVWVAIMILGIILGMCLFILFIFMCCCVTRAPVDGVPPPDEPLMAMVAAGSGVGVVAVTGTAPAARFSVHGKKRQ